jgi:hypothetical protein
LVKRILDVASSPVILVLLSGGCVDLKPFYEHPNMGAIVYAGYLGQAAGQAIADVSLSIVLDVHSIYDMSLHHHRIHPNRYHYRP